ncbi:MAG TPA: argininosuccinate lyase, partial [Dehalococcoidales bacterium]|nr:argininosuccinate lyase [Dehalococcoidales bacterium]
VGKGAAFRTAHEIVGKLVSWATENGKTLAEISLDQYRQFSTWFENDIFLVSVESSVAARNNPGGTAPEQVRAALKEAKKILSMDRNDQ